MHRSRSEHGDGREDRKTTQKTMIATLTSWTVSKLTILFPKIFYCEVYLIDKNKGLKPSNIIAVVWKPKIVDWALKASGAITKSERLSKF